MPQILSDLRGTLETAFRIARATISATGLTASRTVTLPDKSGTVAMMDDIAGRAPTVHTHTASQISDSTVTGRSLITAADAAAGRTALGLGTAATQASSAFEVAGAVAAHTAAGDPHPQYLTPAEASAAYSPLGHTHTASQISDSTVTGRSLITAANAAAGRTALGLGTAATQNTGTSGATVPLLNGANTWGAVQTFPEVRLDAPAGAARPIEWRSGGSPRWRIVASGEAETGGSAGTNLNFTRFDDAGNNLGAPVRIVRSNGTLEVTNGLNITGGAITYGGITQAVVQGGTVTGQLARWNQTTGRYEAFDLLGTANVWTAAQSFTAPLVRRSNGGSWILKNDSADGLIGRGGLWADNDAIRLANELFNAEVIVRANGNVDVNGSGTFNRNGNTVWHAGNFNPGNYGALAGNNTWSGSSTSTGYFSFEVNNNSNLPIATASGGVAGLEALGTGTGAAFMSFHRPGSYAVHFGLDTDNQLKLGGWSMGNVSYVMWHAGNFNPAGKVDVAQGAAAFGDPNTLGGTLSHTLVGGTAGNAPSAFSTIWNLGTNGNRDGQIAWFYGSTTEFWVRSRHDVSGNWNPWRQLWHSGNQAAHSGGTRSGQIPWWNQAAGRWDALEGAITHGDWNTAVENGWWMAPGALNAPIPTQWLIGHVIRHNADWITQEVWDFTSGPISQRYRRQRLGGTWSAWATENPIASSGRFGPTTTDVQFAASTVSGQFGGGYVMRDGSVWSGMWTQNDSTMRFGIGGSGGLAERMRVDSQGFVVGVGNSGAQPGFGAVENGVRRWAWYYGGVGGDQCRLAMYDAGGGYAGDALIIERTTREVSDWRGSIRDVPLNIQNTNYTITTNDRGRKIIKGDDVARTYTIPSGLPQGMTLVIRNKTSVSNITVSPASGVVLRIAGSGTNTSRTIVPWGEALLHCEGVDEWVISGVGVS